MNFLGSTVLGVVSVRLMCWCSCRKRDMFVKLLWAAVLGSGRRRMRALSWVPSQRHSSLPRGVRPTTATVRWSFQSSSETVSTLWSSVPQQLYRTGQLPSILLRT